MKKDELRNEAKQILKELTNDEKEMIEKNLLHNLFTSSLWKNANTIGVTVSRGAEWNTNEIIEAAWDEDKSIVVPKCIPSEKSLVFYQLQHFSQLEVVYYNLLEPNPQLTEKVNTSKIDLLIVPGLLFDQLGYRIGFGGGYYDRLLANYSGVTASLVSERQLIEQIPTESFDIPVKHLITESGVQRI